MAVLLLTPKEFGEKLEPKASGRRIALMCQMGKIPEAQKVGKTWVIPENAKDPRDFRFINKGK